MTQDFTPPGGSSSSDTPHPRADAQAGFSAPSSGSGVPGSGSGFGGSTGGPATGPANMLRSGRRMALAAWIAIIAGVLLLVGIVWSAALALADETLNYAELGDTGTMHAAQLVPGMCLSDVGDDGEVHEVEVVTCDQPHRAEIFTQKLFDLAKHPGDREVRDQALAHCSDRLADQLPNEASWVTWIPSSQSWARGDRVALCIAVFDEPLSEPLSPHGQRGIEAENDGLGT